MPLLTLAKEIGCPRPVGIGRPTDIFFSSSREVVAVSSTFKYLGWPGRSIYSGQKLLYPVSIYSGSSNNRLATLDSCQFPINDIAFHPTLPILAIGTGDYDGGFFFEGELLLWNWETGKVASLLPVSREVIRSKFDDNGNTLTILMRPRDEEEFPGELDVFNVFVGLSLPTSFDVNHTLIEQLNSLQPIDPSVLGFESGTVDKAAKKEKLSNWMNGSGPAEPRGQIWDLTWIDNRTIASVHDLCLFEIWDKTGELLAREVDKTNLPISSPSAEPIGAAYPASGVQVLTCTESSSIFVNVSHSHIQFGGHRPPKMTSSLARVNARTKQFETLLQFDHPLVFSMSGNDWLLGRGDRSHKSNVNDVLIDKSGNIVKTLDLGHYDSFNHFIRLDGGENLYFLQGSPITSHEKKKLCELSPSTGAWQALWPLEWDNSRNAHLVNCCGCFGPDASGECVAIACQFHNYDSNLPFSGFIAYRELSSGKVYWTQAISAQVTAMQSLLKHRMVIYALTNGELGLIDCTTGRLVHKQQVMTDGLNNIILSLAVNDNLIAAGCVDGRILIYQLDMTS